MAPKTRTELETQPIRQVQTVPQLLINSEVKKRLKDVATTQLGPDKFIQLSIEAMRKVPKLTACDPMSFLNAMLQFCSLGLEPNTPLGHAYIIPYGKEATAVIGYKGMISLALRHENVISIHADVVYSDDELWSYEYGSDQHLRHKPGPRDGEKTHVYCYVKLKDGEGFVVLPWAQVLRVRDASQGYKAAIKYNKKDSPWMTHEDTMGIKTAVRAMFNRGELPISAELRRAIDLDEDPKMKFAGGNDFDPLSMEASGLDGDTIEGTATEKEGDKDEPEEKAEPKPKAKAEPKKDGAKEKPAPKTEPKKAGPKDDAEPPIINAIRGDLTDGAPVDATRSFYEEQIDALDEDGKAAVEALFAEFEEGGE